MSFWQALLRYFDLRPDAGPSSRGLGKSQFGWVFQYVALVLGIFVQPYLQAYQTSGVWHWDGALGRLTFSLVMGLVILPAAYRRTFDPGTPGVLRFCTIFVAGIGWQSLVPSAFKAAEKVIASH